MTTEQVKEARRILLDHEYGKRFIPIDLRRLLEQIIKDATNDNQARQHSHLGGS